MNLPNKLTIARVVMIPFVMFFYLANFIPYGIGKLIALVLFIGAALTDLLDGKIARKRNLITNFGKFLDPIADKILTSAVLFLLIADGTIPNPWGVIAVTIIITREFVVSALRLVAAANGRVLAADIWGKAKTMVQMIAIPFAMILSCLYSIGAVNWLIIVTQIIAFTLVLVATVLTVVSGANYLIKNKDCFTDK